MKKTNWVREELSSVKKGAARHNEFAMYELATRYLTGRDVRFDAKAGFHWACQAALSGNAKAMVLCGYCLVRGVGTSNEATSDRIKEAVGWFEDAARLGNATAFYNLGSCYLLGIGKPRSKKAALVYYEAALKMGSKRAKSAIALVEAVDMAAISKAADVARLLLVS